MSPKQITRLALTIGGVSVLGLGAMVVFQPDWGLLAWWPAAGLVLTVLLLVISYLKGAYLSAQQRTNMVELLNDCYTSQTETDRAPQ